MTLLHKIASIPLVYWLWGTFFLLLAGQFLAALFLAYPAAFERELRWGKTWVYIPQRWKGIFKSLVRLFSQALILAAAVSGAALFAHATRRHPAWLVILVGLVLAGAASKLAETWNRIRYRQQEDVYFRVYDEIRARLEQEGKDYTEAQLRHLAAYQHQQQLRKAEEAGEFLKVLRREARQAKQQFPLAPLPEA